jgi:hypothetical protein
MEGFVLSDSAQYAFKCQDVYPDVISFAAAIPDHLKPLFIIPVRVACTTKERIATRLAADGSTPEGDLFSYQTFLYNDIEPTIPNSSPGSIFDIDGADSKTHHQDYNFDQNIQVPTDTSYMSDVDITQYFTYPYRTNEYPVRKSSIQAMSPIIMRMALKSRYLENKTPKKIKNNSNSCTVSVVSYLPDLKVFTFDVKDSGPARTVKAGVSDPDHLALSCDCPFWRYNGPEYNAKNNRYLMGPPVGKAYPPNVRDPKRQYWLCKHAFAVLVRLEKFISDIKKEYPDDSDEEIMEDLADNWTNMTKVVDLELPDLKPDVKLDWETSESDEESVDWSSVYRRR